MSSFLQDTEWEAMAEQVSERLVSVEGFADLELKLQERIEGEVCRIVDYYMGGAFADGQMDERYSLKMQIVNRLTDLLFKEEL